MTDILSMTLAEAEAFAVSLGEKPFRGRQLFAQLHKRLAASFADCTDIPASMRQELANRAYICVPREIRQISDEFRAKKYLLEFEKDIIIESVLMTSDYGTTLCVSSQAGCRMGCTFCASAIGGLVRNLSPGEMLAQVYYAVRESGVPLTNIVLMGCGEPFDNYDNVVKFLELVSCTEGMGLGRRNITVSTCGIVPRIIDFGRLRAGYGLAVSLHSADDSLRASMMPVARAYPLADLMAACDTYCELTHRRVTYEYALIDGVNDSDADAQALAKLLRGRLAHVNLIPLNRVAERGLAPSEASRAQNFINTLKSSRLEATLRRSLGADIGAACGQLRAQTLS